MKQIETFVQILKRNLLGNLKLMLLNLKKYNLQCFCFVCKSKSKRLSHKIVFQSAQVQRLSNKRVFQLVLKLNVCLPVCFNIEVLCKIVSSSNELHFSMRTSRLVAKIKKMLDAKKQEEDRRCYWVNIGLLWFTKIEFLLSNLWTRLH